ncbi:hypothetical protein AWQ21_10255 [Picosynechococcus sp. PCC 7003]|uniref:ribonuclease toxin HepT-like protein n=1 Tax=Picosynechococcus sp. PCC 7003 TaxID=374981 RepID=UPI0008108E50|nr:hypothetical protein [Picosynechococcus sp. PCC 7003]ANV84726.1 hypothetical protein AWQ21_10255 [Picosynechococcus sp. PCC 7003]
MRAITPAAIAEIIIDLENELYRLERLETQMHAVKTEIASSPHLQEMLAESLALKLHNFYTGCERIFQIIASELNGGKPSSYDWHRRLLERMSLPQDYRPPVVTAQTATQLREYLGFRHIVRNIYGFELDFGRIEELVEKYFQVHQDFVSDIRQFIQWLQEFKRTLREESEPPG